MIKLSVALYGWVNAIKKGLSTTEYEGYWEAIITNMINSGRKWYVRPGYEANGPWNNYDKSAYKAVFQYMVDRLRCRGVQAATVFNIAVSGASSSFMDWYPGDSYVDWLGINFFHNNEFTTTVSNNFLAEAELRNKPVIICESSPTDDQVNNGQSDWDKWFKPYFDFIKDNSEVKAFVYINWDWTLTSQWLSWGDCRIETNTTVKNNWVSEISNTIFHHSGWVPSSINTSCNTSWYRVENDGRDWWLQSSGSNNNVFTASQSNVGDYTYWKKVSTGNGWFYLENKGNGKRLKDGPTMVAASSTGNNMQWKEIDAGNGYKRLQNRASGQWLQASGSNNGTYMVGTGSTGPWTKWKFVEAGSSSSRVTSSSDKLSAKEVIGKNGWLIYPNPSATTLNVRNTDAAFSTLILRNIQGKTLIHQKITAQEALDVSGLSEGLYVLELLGEEATEQHKILIER